MPKPRVTKDGLAVVSEETFVEVVTSYPIASAQSDPEIRAKIEAENPQIYRILKLGSMNAPTPAARSYYEMGIELAYELIRAESAKIKDE